MKFSKLFILTILSLIIITMSSVIFATNAVSDITNGVGTATRDIGNGIANTAKDIGNGVKNGVNDLGTGVSNTASNVTNGVINTKDTLTNDITTGISDNARNTDTTNRTTNNYSTNNYTASPVGYTDTVDFLGMTMSRTSLILLVIALAAIIAAVLVFAYVSQDNDRYRDDV